MIYDDSTEIKRWSNCTQNLSEADFKFFKKALQQQLATAANMHRWDRSTSNLCSLCNWVQTNKHILSNCSAPGPLARCTQRHDLILRALVDFLISALPSSSTVFSDLPGPNPINQLFKSLRPDIAILSNNKVTALELTVCHESNFKSAKERKLLKYKDLKSNLKPTFSNCRFEMQQQKSQF